MGRENTEGCIIVGIANHSPLDFDAYIDKNLKRTTNPKDEADVLYTKKPTDTNIKAQVVFNDYEYLESWGLIIGDSEKGKRINLTNDLTDELLGKK